MIDAFHRRRAFTLIEVIVVVAIISIATVITFVSFAGQRSIRGLDRASHEVVSILREAQGYALAGHSQTGEKNCWIGIDISGAGANYSVMKSYPSGACTSTASISSYTLKEGVAFPGAERIVFTLPRGEVMYLSGGALTALSSGSSRRITVTKNAVSHYICVYSTGRIVENGTTATCP